MSRDAAIEIGAEALHAVNPRLFGQFMERASWGEPGPEAVLQEGEKDLPEAVLEHFEAMNVPLIRYPGGSDIKVLDWTDWISNAPNREDPERPVSKGMRGDPITNNFGLDEYFRLRDRLGAETILVVNLHDALYKEKALEAAARHAAGLVAYCNAPAGAKLPEGMPDWPAIRAKNGHPEPFGVEYFQIGNETYFFWPPKAKAAADLGLESFDAQAEYYIQCVVTKADAMRAVDPSIRLILDGPRQASHDESDVRRALFYRVAADPRVRERFEYLSYHAYAGSGTPVLLRVSRPEDGPIDDFETDRWWKDRVSGTVLRQDEIDAESLWYVWMARPGYIDGQGLNNGLGEITAFVKGLGYRIACTEWNFNHWGVPDLEGGLKHQWASGLGAAGFIHGMLRQADVIELGAQSMMLGVQWGINSVRYDPERDPSVYFHPQGRVTAFYSNNVGTAFLPVTYRENPRVPIDAQYVDGWGWPEQASLALVDAVATRNEEMLFVHLLHREFSDSRTVEIRLDEAFGLSFPTEATQRMLTGDITVGYGPNTVHDEESVPLVLESNTLKLSLPPRSISILRIPLPATP
ncbi:MAG: hypothetical protein ACFB20_04175 [Opitutales bacterium]